jgi:hypothetical protein
MNPRATTSAANRGSCGHGDPKEPVDESLRVASVEDDDLRRLVFLKGHSLPLRGERCQGHYRGIVTDIRSGISVNADFLVALGLLVYTKVMGGMS